LLLAASLTVLAASSALAANPPRVDAYGDPLPPGAIARIGSTSFRHSDGPVVWATFTPDANRLLSATSDNVRFWDLRTGKMLAELASQRDRSIRLLAASPDGKVLAVQRLRSVIVIDTATLGDVGEVQLRWPEYNKATNGVEYAAFSLDGKRLVLDSMGTVRVVEWKTGTVVLSMPGERVLYCPAIDMLAIANGDSTGDVALCRATDGTVLRTLEGKSTKAYPEAFSSDGRLLDVRTDAGRLDRRGRFWPSYITTARVIEVATGKEIRAFPTDPYGQSVHGRHSPIGRRDLFWPDGSRIAVEDGDGWHVYSLPDGREITLLRHRPLRFSPDGKTLACADFAHVQLMDVATWRGRDEVSSNSGDPVVILGDNKRIATFAANGDGVLVWEAESGRLLDKIALDEPVALAGAGSPTTLFIGQERKVTAWDVDRRKPVAEVRVSKTADVSSLRVAADGKTFAVIDKDKSERRSWGVIQIATAILVYSSKSGKEIARLEDGASPEDMIISPDGDIVASNEHNDRADDESRDSRVVWDVRNRCKVTSAGWAGATNSQAQFLRNGHLLVTVEREPNGTPYAVIYEIATGAVATRLAPHADFLVMPGERAALENVSGPAGHRNGDVQTWDLATGEPLAQVERQHLGSGLVLFPNGRRCADRLMDGTLGVWKLPQGLLETSQPALKQQSELDAVWNSLGGDAKGAYPASFAAAAGGGTTVRYIRRHWKLPDLDERMASRMAENLHSENVDVRALARGTLKSLGPRTMPLIRAAAVGRKDTEKVTQEIEELSAELSGPMIADREELRRVRAIEVLEMIGDAAARDLLRMIAQGPVEARETRYAAGALARIGHSLDIPTTKAKE
jgi:WD40 repeat protein